MGKRATFGGYGSHFYSAEGGEMMRRMVCTVAATLLLSGCLFEGAGPVNRNEKPFSADWVKEGMTREGRQAAWVECGGAASGRYGYEIQNGQSHKEFFEGLNAHVTRINACMKKLGYTHLAKCDARCF